MHPDEAAIRQLVDTWDRATLANDLDAIAPLMAEDVVYLVAGQPPMRGRDTFMALARSLFGASAPRIESSGEFEEIRLMGDFAYAVRHLKVTMTPPGGVPVRRAGPVLSVFRREADGRWVLARDANLLTLVE